MAWTVPVTRATGYLVLASDWNAEHTENLKVLHGDSGTITQNMVSTGPDSSARFNGSQTDGGSIDGQGQFLSICNAAVEAFAAGATADTNPRWTVDSNGNMRWGPGGGTAVDAIISRVGAGLFKLGQPGGSKGNYRGGYNNSAPGLPATFTPDAAYLLNRVAPINNSGTLTIGAPSNPPSTSESAFFFMIISNTTGGVLTISWNAAFNNTLTTPANGTANAGICIWNPSISKWYIVAPFAPGTPF